MSVLTELHLVPAWYLALLALVAFMFGAAVERWLPMLLDRLAARLRKDGL